ncbi:hypothetical protein EDC01DRAFT_419370 [Geopyxis carbonaria]|nr:hypothetical protein EDC01DRAFT_419370 [Geopyxis carbonaria]
MSMFDSVLNGRQSVYLENKAQRIFRAVERARSQFLQKTRPHSNTPDTAICAGSHLDRLPLELVLDIIGRTTWRDCVNLRLVCSGFRSLIDTDEHAICAALLHPRNHSPRTRTNHLTQLSRLFTPPRSSDPDAAGARRYTLPYVCMLEKRHNVCSQLAFHLASRAVAPLFARAAGSRRERHDLAARRTQAIAIISSRLRSQLYHVLYFLTYLRLRLRARLALLAAENTSDDPPTLPQLASIYRSVQAELVAPFADATLVSTHHAFHFLVNSLRIGISPEPPHTTNDATVSVLLRCPAPLTRAVEFFAADAPASPPRLRRTFMLDMQRERDELRIATGGGGRKRGKSLGARHTTEEAREHESWSPKIGEVWFEVARAELRRRGLERHRSDGVYFFPECQGEVLVGCPECIVK